MYLQTKKRYETQLPRQMSPLMVGNPIYYRIKKINCIVSSIVSHKKLLRLPFSSFLKILINRLYFDIKIIQTKLNQRTAIYQKNHLTNKLK